MAGSRATYHHDSGQAVPVALEGFEPDGPVGALGAMAHLGGGGRIIRLRRA